MKITNKKWFPYLILLIETIIFTMPYLCSSSLQIGHDSFFHLARIEAYAKEISHGSFFPLVYPFQNGGFGYGTPSFYSDLFLLPFSLLYLMKVDLVTCYKLLIFFYTYLFACSTYACANYFCKEKKNSYAIYLTVLLVLGSNYHITDVYVRGAIGEVIALVFFPLLLMGLFQCFNKEDSYLLACSLVGLLLSHNLSFLLGCILCVVLCLSRITSINKQVFTKLFKNVALAFCLTVFYSIPMLEQLGYQDYFVKYSTYKDMYPQALNFKDYFAYQTVYGYGVQSDVVMLVNLGFFLPLFTLFTLFDRKASKAIHLSSVLGILFYLVQSKLFPYSFFKQLNFLQFPWRFNLLALTCMIAPTAYQISKLSKKNEVIGFSCIALCSICFHLIPITQKPFLEQSVSLEKHTTWKDVLDGKIIDPYFSAFYKRVELAGGDYLPSNSIDYQHTPFQLYDLNLEKIDEPYWLDPKGNLCFTNNQERSLVLPKTCYLGYTLIDQKTLQTYVVKPYLGLCSIEHLPVGSYQLVMRPTLCRKICRLISLITLFGFLIYRQKEKTTRKCM